MKKKIKTDWNVVLDLRTKNCIFFLKINFKSFRRAKYEP